MQEQYISRLKEQDPTVISALYDAYSGALYGIALRIVQAPELAEQVIQDTFVKVWRNSASYDSSKGRLFTWLANIARNTAIDVTRTAQFQKSRKTDSIETLVHSPGGAAINPDHIGVREAVDKLDEKYRLLIELLYFKGYTQKEAAKETGIPIGTIKTRLRYAMSDLRRLFEVTIILYLILALVL